MPGRERELSDHLTDDRPVIELLASPRRACEDRGQHREDCRSRPTHPQTELRKMLEDDGTAGGLGLGEEGLALRGKMLPPRNDAR